MRTRRVIIEEVDLLRFEANIKRIKSVGTNNEVAPRRQVVAPSDGPHFRSKWEAAYAGKLELEKRAGIIKAYWHEPFSLWLPGKVRYKPDFLVQYFAWPAGCLEIVEVKGFSKNRRDGITRLKIAAALFPCFTWRMVYRTKGGGWDGQYL